MLSLKDFKEYEIKGHDSLVKISGGIECDAVWGVMEHLSMYNKAQFDQVVYQLRNGGIQCTQDGGWYNMTDQ
ncbi:MAG: hypothetical protein IPO98_07990 [Saprospiraceae bacterium]|jgi:hypothetical protein|nr:hypothetical protein [Saprospiraceae bacterium]